MNKPKIIAVIPARKGSKGIPNKNIRLLAGRPLVWYAMQNALNSRYIDDVIVSTDSEEVGIIAKQLGIKVHWRSKELTEDDVTLDSVIYDAVKEENSSYVITMQPTSPTLKVSTLDDAILYSIEKDADTVISVINRPHLAWERKEGRVVPAYKERLNRQYLPEHYEETGAFFISKSKWVTSKSRLGEKVDVFPISEEESIDIDTFSDLLIAEAFLSTPKVAMYVNGNRYRGTGHVYRSLELADEFNAKPDIYYDVNQTNKEIFGETTHNLIPVDGLADLYNVISKKDYSLFINDILDTNIDYMIGLCKCLPHAKIINFEDSGEGTMKADVVINSLYDKSNNSNVFSGPKYYICPKSFLFYEPIQIKEHVKNVFISFGGADPQDYTDRLLKIIDTPEYKNLKFTVVLGRAKDNVEELLQYNNRENIQVIYDTNSMPELMVQCDIGVTSRGRTAYELAILGIPTISIAQNERENQHSFVNNENGFSYIGMNPGDEVIKGTLDMYINLSKSERLKYQEKILNHDLKSGRKRVINLIENI